MFSGIQNITIWVPTLIEQIIFFSFGDPHRSFIKATSAKTPSLLKLKMGIFKKRVLIVYKTNLLISFLFI